MALIDSPQMLQYIDMLLKHGNYTKAAKVLYISQPYLTQTIKKVEQELGIEIINRHSTPLQLTEAGTIYYQYLSSLETKQDQFKKKIAKYSTPDLTIIRIGILPSLGTYLLPLFLTKFLAENSHVKIELIETIPAENEKKLLNGEIDFLIGQNPETLSPNLTVNHVGDHGYYAVIPASSQLYQEGTLWLPANSIPLKKLLAQNLILTARGSAIRRQVDYLFQKYRIQPTIVIESADIFTVVELAKSNLGVTFVPESVKTNTLDTQFNLYPLPLESLSLAYFIAHRANKSLIPAENTLIDCFISSLESSLKNSLLEN
ncbi:DNA-binding transcriptional LysR family regulator [Enterococcus sp. PF1-24]|uniref:LysR family transcriptional regulator n=1 Tax=unclassified Enterococcus TaxID=2608891 RepID=UPI002474F3EF|nr:MULTISPECIES: LysR family transcriptional regulator [unclassified Enterococcus]MDH6363894.1 DNA-binding transcriptional LysR family regulator [Enterococcus sp. PFB1-1]MDH6400920.1 DNA-binding transcriptional LysR family regulator [Enterococcus sp. PF1-24]